jgi:hypothetical protein
MRESLRDEGAGDRDNFPPGNYVAGESDPSFRGGFIE